MSSKMRISRVQMNVYYMLHKGAPDLARIEQVACSQHIIRMGFSLWVKLWNADEIDSGSELSRKRACHVPWGKRHAHWFHKFDLCDGDCGNIGSCGNATWRHNRKLRIFCGYFSQIRALCATICIVIAIYIYYKFILLAK